MPYIPDGLVAEFSFDNTLSSTDRFPLGTEAAPETVYLVEATVYDPGLPGTRVLRWCTGAGYVYGGNYYEPRVSNPGRLKMALFGEGRTGGASTIGFGEVVLVNADGGLDALTNYGFDGRTLMIKRALAIGAVLSAVVTLAACSMEQPTHTLDEVAIRIKDRQMELNVPLQPNKYGGTNALPAGVDGTADIKGRPKPLLFGVGRNVSPVCVNTARLIYQIHDGALTAVSAVYDKGIPLTAGAAYASQADMEANAPAPGQYRVWLAGGMLRLGATPAGVVTADATENTAEYHHVAEVMKRIALKAPTIVSGDFNTIDFADLYNANLTNTKVGFYSAAETTVAAALDQVAASIGAWYGFGADGKMRCGQLKAPVSGAIRTWTEPDLLSIERLPTSDEGRGVPVWRVNLGYDRNWSAAALATDVKNLARWEVTSLPVSAEWNGLAFGADLFVATIGFGSSGNGSTTAYATSPNGRTWTSRTFPAAGWYEDIAYGGSSGGAVFVALDSAGKSMRSADGLTGWTQGTLPAGYGIYNRVLSYGTGFLAWRGTDSTNGAYSADGQTWTYVLLPGGVRYDAKAGGGTILLMTASGVYRSTNVTAWTPVSMPSGTWTTCYFDGSVWWAMGTNGSVAVSSDATAVSWTLVAGGTGLDTMYVSAWGDGISVVGARRDYLYVSADHVVRSPVRALAGGSLERIVFGGGVFVALNYGEWSVATWSLADAKDRAQWLPTEYRTVTASDAAVKTKHLLARELNVNTLLVDPSAAQYEADRLLALYKEDRARLKVKVRRADLPADLLGKVVRIQLPRYGWGAGKLFVVIGLEEDHGTPNIVLDLWG